MAHGCRTDIVYLLSRITSSGDLVPDQNALPINVRGYFFPSNLLKFPPDYATVFSQVDSDSEWEESIRVCEKKEQVNKKHEY